MIRKIVYFICLINILRTKQRECFHDDAYLLLALKTDFKSGK